MIRSVVRNTVWMAVVAWEVVLVGLILVATGGRFLVPSLPVPLSTEQRQALLATSSYWTRLG